MCLLCPQKAAESGIALNWNSRQLGFAMWAVGKPSVSPGPLLWERSKVSYLQSCPFSPVPTTGMFIKISSSIYMCTVDKENCPFSKELQFPQWCHQFDVVHFCLAFPMCLSMTRSHLYGLCKVHISGWYGTVHGHSSLLSMIVCLLGHMCVSGSTSAMAYHSKVQTDSK